MKQEFWCVCISAFLLCVFVREWICVQDMQRKQVFVIFITFWTFLCNVEVVTTETDLDTHRLMYNIQ